ncbi:MAG: DMT family transporter [Prevotella sp.]|nr:DMT family transporter [Prevotella sp.]
MWLTLAFLSAALLGFYDSFKKKALQGNAVIPVLFLNTVFSSVIFLPLILLSYNTRMLDNTIFYVASGGWEVHKYIVLKSVIVLFSWLFGYFGIKHLPLTIVGPINATRPVMTLVGALIVFGERLNVYQWIGVVLAMLSFMLLSRSSKKEGIDFKHDIWIYFIVIAALLGAVSGLYDKYLMASVDVGGLGLDRMMVQGWYNIYQCFWMFIMLAIIWMPVRHRTTPFHWDWSIIFISIFLCTADFVYFYALSVPDAMISIVSMVRRGSVIVSFLFGALLFREKNIKSKALDLALVMLGMLFLYFGSK